MTTGSAIRHFTLDPRRGHRHRPRRRAALPRRLGRRAQRAGDRSRPEERSLYVAETMKARILRFPVEPDGSVAMPRLATFRSPVPGLPMSHWR
jgi:hypothetical protein